MEENRILDAIIANNNAISTIADAVSALTSTMNEKFDAVDKKFDAMHSEMNEKFDAVNNDIRTINIVLENDIKDKIDAIYDGYKLNSERIDRLVASCERLSIPISDIDLYRRVSALENGFADHLKRHA